MALKAIVESVDTLPEAARGFYQEQDGKFVLQVEPVNGMALEDVEGLKTTFSKEMTKRKELEKTLLKFKDIDPDKAREAMTKLEELGNFDPLKDADRLIAERVEVAKRQLLEKHHNDIATRDAKLGQMSKSFQNLLIDQAATAVLAEAKGSVELLLPHVQRYTRVKETENGGYQVEVIDRDGNARIANSKGDPMTIKDLVQEMRQSEAYGRAFEGSGQSGSGTRPSGGGGNPSSRVTKADLKGTDVASRKARSAFVTAYGYDAYKALPDK